MGGLKYRVPTNFKGGTRILLSNSSTTAWYLTNSTVNWWLLLNLARPIFACHLTVVSTWTKAPERKPIQVPWRTWRNVTTSSSSASAMEGKRPKSSSRSQISKGGPGADQDDKNRGKDVQVDLCLDERARHLQSVVLYTFHYNYGNRCKVIYTDTDSFTYHMTCPSVWRRT